MIHLWYTLMWPEREY